MKSHESWRAWLEAWDPGEAGCERRIREKVSAILGALDVPLLELRPDSLTLAHARAMANSKDKAPLAWTRAFLKWCQERGSLPAYLVFVKSKSVGPAAEIMAVPPACPRLLNLLASWKPKKRRLEAYRKAVHLILRRFNPDGMDGRDLRRFAHSIGFDPRYAENALCATRSFLRELQDRGDLRRDLIVTAQPRLVIKRPPLSKRLERELQTVLDRWVGKRTRRGLRQDVGSRWEVVFRDFIAYLQRTGRRIDRMSDLSWADFQAYQRELLRNSVSPFTGEKRLPKTIGQMLVSLLTFVYQAAWQEVPGVKAERFDKFRIDGSCFEASGSVRRRRPLPLPLIERLLQFDEAWFESMSPVWQFYYLRNKVMIIVQWDMWLRTEDVARITDELLGWDEILVDGRLQWLIKNGKSRAIGAEPELRSFLPETVKWMRRWLEFRTRFFELAGVKVSQLVDRKDPTGTTVLGTPFFCSIDGEPISPDAYERVFKQLLHDISPDQAKLYTAYSVRHAGAYKALYIDRQPINLVAKRLRDTIETTLKYYATPGTDEEFDKILLATLQGAQPAAGVMPMVHQPRDPESRLTVAAIVARYGRSHGVTDDQAYRAIKAKELEARSETDLTGRRVMTVAADAVEAWVNSVSLNEMSELAYGKRGTNIYRAKGLPSFKAGSRRRVPAIEAIKWAIEKARSRRQRTPRALRAAMAARRVLRDDAISATA